MSVLNLPSDGIFNVLIVVVRTLVRFGPQTRDGLFTLCGVDTGKVEQGYLTNVLNRWEQLGLLLSDGGVYHLREPYKSELGANPDAAETRLSSVARRIALSPQNNAQFWEQEKSLAADLSRGLSWMLAQDVYAISTASHGPISRLETDQLINKDHCILRNDVRWNGLQAWMLYLGFARGGAELTPDPTVAIKDALSDVFEDETTLTAVDFIERLGRVLPVLDGGAYRLMLEGALDAATWRRPAEGRLSTSLSRALKRLVADGHIALDVRHDFESGWTLTGVAGADWGRATHVRRRVQGMEAR